MAIAGTLTYKTELDTSGVKKAGSTVKNIVAGLGITKLISKAMSTITSSVDDAIKRVDTLNNFPKVMSNLGISADKSSKAINKMSDKLSGLPTTLDQGAMAVQRFTSKNGDVMKSTDIFLALNNAILAGGASTEIQATALEQMSQAYAKGKPDMMEWRSVMTAMPAQLNQVAQAMGLGKNGADELGEGLRKGYISMDKFMATIVQLNKKGTKGFQSFEQQARNSTGGIATSITVAKTQIVKGVADIISGIDKGLKKSGTSINKIISDLGKKAKVVLSGIGTALSKIDFNKLYETLKNLSPVITAVVTAFVSYYTITKLITAINMAKNIISATAALVGLTSATNLSSGAMSIFNAVMDANPTLLMVSAVAGLTTAMIVLSKNTSEYTKEQQKQIEQAKKAEETSKEELNTYEELIKTKQKQASQNMSELSYYNDLRQELSEIVDANGKVKKGYEGRASFIADQLSKYLGVEIELNNGVIKGYKGIIKSIDNLIEKKKAQIMLEAQEELYAEAIKNQDKAYRDLAKSSEEYNKIQEKRKKTEKELEEQRKRYKELIFDVDSTERDHVEARISELKRQLKAEEETESKREKTYQNNKKRLEEYNYYITTYEKNAELSKKGHYDKMTDMDWEYVKNQKKTLDEQEKQYIQKINTIQGKITYLQSIRNESNKKEVDAEIKKQQKLLEEQEKGLKNYQENTKNALTKDEKQWIDTINSELNNVNGKKVEFKSAGKGLVQMYVDGVASGKPKTIGEAKKIADGMKTELNKSKAGAKQAGIDFTTGAKEGINEGKGSIFSAVTSLGNSILTTFKTALKEQSPSKATREMGLFLDQGVELGVKDGEKDTLSTINKFGNNVISELSEAMNFNKELDDMYKEINKTIKLENAKLNFDVMSNDIYNKSLQLPAIIDLSANFEGTVPVELNLDGEKIYDNQQKISLRKSIQYGGVQ